LSVKLSPQAVLNTSPALPAGAARASTLASTTLET